MTDDEQGDDEQGDDQQGDAQQDPDSTGDPQGSSSTGDPQLDRQVADLEDSGEKVSNRIEETRSDWEAKKADPSVPGAAKDPAAPDDSSAEEDGAAEQADEPYEWVDPDAAAKDEGPDEDSDAG